MEEKAGTATLIARHKRCQGAEREQELPREVRGGSCLGGSWLSDLSNQCFLEAESGSGVAGWLRNEREKGEACVVVNLCC